MLIRTRFSVFTTLIAVSSAGALRGQSSDDLFDTSVIHEIRMTMDPADFVALSNETDKTYYTGTVEFEGVTVTNVALRQKGRSSLNATKPSFKMDFNKNVKGQKFLGLKGLNLKSDVQDASQLKQRVAMLFFNRAGVAAPRESHALVYMNGQLLGLYIIDEAIDDSFLQRNFGETDGNLYNFEGDPEYNFEYLGPDYAAYQYDFSPESPDDPDTTALIAWITAINQSSDANFVSQVGQYLDWHQFLTELAVENYLAELDGVVGEGGMNNLYFYQLQNTTKFIFIPQDKDNTFQDVNYSIFQRFGMNVLVKRAMANPALLQIYLNALMKCYALAGQQGGWLEQEITYESNQIRSAVYADPFKQCNNLSVCTNQDFENQVADELTFAETRPSIILPQITAQHYAVPSTDPQIFTGGVVDSLTYKPQVQTSGYFSIFGQQLASDTEYGDSTTTYFLGGSTVFVNGFPAPLSYVSPGQINAVLPSIVPGGSQPVAVISGTDVGSISSIFVSGR